MIPPLFPFVENKVINDYWRSLEELTHFLIKNGELYL